MWRFFIIMGLVYLNLGLSHTYLSYCLNIPGWNTAQTLKNGSRLLLALVALYTVIAMLIVFKWESIWAFWGFAAFIVMDLVDILWKMNKVRKKHGFDI